MNTQIRHLLEKYVDNKCNLQELQQVKALLESGAYEQEWSSVIKNMAIEKIAQDENPADGQHNAIKQQVLERIEQTIGIAKTSRGNKIPLWKWIGSVAAAVALIASLSLYINSVLSDQRGSEQARVTPAVIVPGSNQAVLTLASGKKIVLDTVKNGIFARQGSTAIGKPEDGSLVFTSTAGDNGTGSESDFNEIITPRGGQYKLILSDGTQVWLNAASSIRFPAAFNGHKRQVSVTGEVYFEVSKDKSKPFIVSSPNQQTEVLGTHFNINAYPEEEKTRTTLLEGSVKINSGRNSVLIKPGEQSVQIQQELSVHQVNANNAVAWVNGEFAFKTQDLGSIMRSIARWYNIEVSFAQHLENKRFTGTISRYKNVSEVLEMLELTGVVHFKIEGRRIIVMK